MKDTFNGYIKDESFQCIVENTPLISIDFIVRNQEKILLGKRVNRPALGYWFTLGGRVFKDEYIKDAIKRISETELGTPIENDMKFIGVFEHHYDDSIFDNVSTHYINLGYEVEVSGLEDLPMDQHEDYRWFGLEELMQSDEVHIYVKDYFTKSKGIIPQYKER